jgi:hypothetical protein
MVTFARPSIARVSLIAMPRVFQPVDDRQRQTAVDRLVLADERDGQVLELAVWRRQAHAVVRAEHAAGLEPVAELDRLAGDIERRADLLGHARLSTASTPGSCWATIAGTPCLKMPAFSSCDLLDRVAQLGHVVLGDRGDGSDLGLEHVRAIEAPAKARLDDDQLRLLLAKYLNAMAVSTSKVVGSA